MYWYLKAMKSSFDFKGRARRKEFWYFCLFHYIFIVLPYIATYILDIYNVNAIIRYPIYIACSALFFIPMLSVTVRRLHDIGRSGWNFLIGFIPIVGFVLPILFAQESDEGANKYGPNPKSETIL